MGHTWRGGLNPYDVDRRSHARFSKWEINAFYFVVIQCGKYTMRLIWRGLTWGSGTEKERQKPIHCATTCRSYKLLWFSTIFDTKLKWIKVGLRTIWILPTHLSFLLLNLSLSLKPAAPAPAETVHMWMFWGSVYFSVEGPQPKLQPTD